MRLLLIFVLLIGVAFGQLPSDLITNQPAPVAIDLCNVAPSSAEAIDSANVELTAFKGKNLADLGHYCSGVRYFEQGLNDTATNATITFLGGKEATGNGTGAANLSSYNGTLVWM
jgi:hypothetical protein